MVDEDIVIGYILGYNGKPDKTIIGKSITKNGTYHAADDNADGFDPVTVNVRGLSQKDIDDLIKWVIDQLKPQLPDDTPELVPPEITVNDSDLKPSLDGCDRPYLTAVSQDGKYTYVMYGMPEGKRWPNEIGLSKQYYVDTFFNGRLVSHKGVCSVVNIPASATDPNPENTYLSIAWELRQDGTIKITHSLRGTLEYEIKGPYISGDAVVWNV